MRHRKTFVLCAGRSGSRYIVELLTQNGYDDVAHEATIPRNEQCDMFHGRLDQHEAVDLVKTRKRDEVWFEANHYLFSFADALKDAYPDARFIHLFRDGRSHVRSILSEHGLSIMNPHRPSAWQVTERRVPPDDSGQYPAPWFYRACRYWNEVNGRIWDDLMNLPPEDAMILPAELLWNGDAVPALERFLNVELPNETLGPVGSQSQYTFPSYSSWPRPCKDMFNALCRGMMYLLGYDLDEPVGEVDDWTRVQTGMVTV